MPQIALNNVCKSFGAVDVINDVSLEISENEFVVFLGPSGSGKSTLLRMIAGLESIDSGEILITGDRVDHLPPGQRQVAMVFQNYALYPHMKVSENMAFGLRNIGTSADEVERRITEAAQILEIEELLDRKPAQLSGGQRQRVAIGRAIVKEPKVFLFDEPLSNLDAALRVRTRVELAQLHQRMKSTMVYVTHDQTEAMTLADRIVILNDRAIEQIGTPMEVYARPASKFVAEFVGSPAMNLIPVSKNEAGQNITLADGNALKCATTLPDGSNARWLGIRPENLIIVADGGTMGGKASVVEQLGERTLVYVELGDGTTVIAQDSSQSKVVPGDLVRLEIDVANTHLFDDSGKAYHPA